MICLYNFKDAIQKNQSGEVEEVVLMEVDSEEVDIEVIENLNLRNIF